MSSRSSFSHSCRLISHVCFASVHPLSAMHFLHSCMLRYIMHFTYVTFFSSTAHFTVKWIVPHDQRKKDHWGCPLTQVGPNAATGVTIRLTMSYAVMHLKGDWHEIFDFRFFFMNQCPPGPQVFHWILIEFFRKFEEIHIWELMFNTGEQFIFPRCCWYRTEKNQKA